MPELCLSTCIYVRECIFYNRRLYRMTLLDWTLSLVVYAMLLMLLLLPVLRETAVSYNRQYTHITLPCVDCIHHQHCRMLMLSVGTAHVAITVSVDVYK
jgi:hypothetical protein